MDSRRHVEESRACPTQSSHSRGIGILHSVNFQIESDLVPIFIDGLNRNSKFKLLYRIRTFRHVHSLFILLDSMRYEIIFIYVFLLKTLDQVYGPRQCLNSRLIGKHHVTFIVGPSKYYIHPSIFCLMNGCDTNLSCSDFGR